MTAKQWEYVFKGFVILCVGALCFFLGRKTIKEEPAKVVKEYVKGETVRDTIMSLVPYKVVEPIDTLNIIRQCVKDGIYAELWPTKIVTEYIETTKADTTLITKDWASTRYYSETLFENDTLGTCKVDAQVQYNRLKSLGYEFTPYVKNVTTTVYKTKLFSPYVGVGGMYNPWDENKDFVGQINGGFFIKEKYGLQLQYSHSFSTKNDYFGGALLWKF